MKRRHPFFGSPLALLGAAAVFAAAGGAAGWYWSGQSASDVTTGPLPVPVAAAQTFAVAPFGSAGPAGVLAPGSITTDAPANIVLVGTSTGGREPAATFLIDGQMHAVALGARLGGSILVLTQITPHSVLVGLPGGASEVEIKLRPAHEISQSLTQERQAGGVAADLGVKGGAAGADTQPLQRRGDTPGAAGSSLPSDMVLTAPRRERQKPGPVGAN